MGSVLALFGKEALAYIEAHPDKMQEIVAFAFDELHVWLSQRAAARAAAPAPVAAPKS